jgi:hypothetical protein
MKKSSMWLFAALFCSFHFLTLNESTWNWLLHALIIYVSKVQCCECISSNEPSFRACFSFKREAAKDTIWENALRRGKWLIMKFIIFCKYGLAWNLFQSHFMFSSSTLLLPLSVTHTCRYKNPCSYFLGTWRRPFWFISMSFSAEIY